MRNVGVLFGGPSPEHDISILTGLQAARVLADAGNDVQLLHWTKVGSWRLLANEFEAADFAKAPPQGRNADFSLVGEAPGLSVAGSLGRRRTVEFDAIVNCCHGGPGEDGRLQGALDIAGIKYTGPSAAGAALGMDKLAFGAVVAAAGLPTLPRAALVAGGDVPFAGPYIVKPRFGGSSIGIEIVETVDDAIAVKSASIHLRGGAVIEPYRPELADLHINVRTWPALELSMIERPRRDDRAQFFTYEQKYLQGDALFGEGSERPAILPGPVADVVTDAARRLAVAGLVRGSARLDFLWAGDEVWVNEINTIPGALGLQLWRASGVEPRTLLEDLCQEAVDSPTPTAGTSGSDSRALLSADAIRSKLG